MVCHPLIHQCVQLLHPGFSSGENPDLFKGQYESGYDPLWEDMILRHHTQAMHCMVGGGDQIYCDAITREPELQGELGAFNVVKDS